MQTIKEYLSANKSKLEERKAQLETSLIDCESKEVRNEIAEAIKEIDNDIDGVKEQIDAIDEPATDDVVVEDVATEEAETTEEVEEAEEEKEEERKLEVTKTMEMRNGQVNEVEARAEEFAKTGVEKRSVLVSSGLIATPTGVDGISDNLNTYNSLIDRVKVTNASGMGQYKVAFLNADASASTQTEGGAYNASDPTYGFATINPSTLSVISYISKQVKKQSPLNYQAKTEASALKALRTAVATNVINGIIASSQTKSVTLTAIDETVLRKIALNYGGTDEIVGGAELILNKATLIKLGDFRGTNEKAAVYEITPDASNPNTGIIKDGGLTVKYSLSTNVPNDEFIYGAPECFELALFGDYEIAVSEDYQFANGLLAIRGDVEIGGEVIVKDGFIHATL